MMPVYRIRDWSEHFESSETRKVKGPLRWVAIKTKHDGKTYQRLMRQPNAAALYGAWILIVAVAGKCPVHGVLADEDGPLTPDDLEAKTGMSAAVFAEAIRVLSSERFKWIEQVSDPGPVAALPAITDNAVPQESSAGVPADSSVVHETPLINQATPHHSTSPDQTEQDIIPPDTRRDGESPARSALQGDGRGGGYGGSKKFSLWRNATREQILTPPGAERVFKLALDARICTRDERLHVFRLILSLQKAEGNLPAILTAVLRGDAGIDPWRARGGDFESQAREWIRTLDVPPQMQQRVSNLDDPSRLNASDRQRLEEYRRRMSRAG